MTLSRSFSSSDTRPESRMSFSSCSISISTTDSSCSSDSDESSINRPVLHHRRRERDTHGKKATRNGNATMQNSSSRRLKTFKKKLASTLKKKNYEAIDSSGRTFGQSPITSGHRTNSGESRWPPSHPNSDNRRRPGVRRTVSYEDEFHSLYKAASRVSERQDSDEHVHGRAVFRRHSSNASDNSFGTRETRSSSPSVAEDLLRYPFSGNSAYARNETFGRMPNTMSTPNLMDRAGLRSGHKSPTPSTSNSSRASSKTSKSSSTSTNELLSRAGAVAGRKQWKQSNQAFPPLAPQSASSSSPHLLATAESVATQKKLRRQSDTDIDLTFFRKHLETIEASLNKSPTILEDTWQQEQSSTSNRDSSLKSDFTGVSNNRRRSKTKRQYHNEIVMEPKAPHDTNNEDKQRTQQTKDKEASQRRYMFRKDFPRDPIPSDAILMRLYSNVPPPPPLNNKAEEQATANDDIMAIPLGKTLKQHQSILSPAELQKDKDAASCLTFDSLEWRVWKESVDKSRRGSKTKHVSTDDNANDASRRSESSRSKTSSASSRPSSQRELKPIESSDRHRSRSGGNKVSKSRLVPKIKSETSNSGRDIRSNELESCKRKGKRRDGMSVSAHGGKQKSKKRDSFKVKGKNSHQSPRLVSSDLFPMSPETPSTRDLSHDSSTGSHGFQNALLNLSNGSFEDSNHELSDHRIRTSLKVLRNSLTKMNSVRSFNSSGIPKPASQSSFNSSGGFMSSGAESFAEADDKTDREQRKKRRGKRGGSIGSESRCKNSERRHSTKTRRGRRGSKSKPPSDDASQNYDFDDSVSFEFEASLNDLRPSVSREGSRRNVHDDIGGKIRKSPKVTKKGHETESLRRRSPKVVSKKISRDDSTGKKGKSPRTIVRKNSKKQDSYPSPQSSPRNSSRKKVSAPSSPFKTPSTEFENPNSNLVNDQEFTPLSPRFGKHFPEQPKKEEDDFYDLALSSWVDRPKETLSPSSPRAKKYTEPPRRKESLKGRNARWLPEISPGTRSAVTRVTHISEEPPSLLHNPTMPSPSPKAKPDKSNLNFPLDFVEYTDVSPLTVASKKVTGIPIDNRFQAPIGYMDA